MELWKVLLVKGMWNAENDFPRPPIVVSPGLHSGQLTTFTSYHEIFLKFQLIPYCYISLMQIIFQRKAVLLRPHNKTSPYKYPHNYN